MEAFWAGGFVATSLDQLCAAMGIGRSSFYQAFGSKHDLLLATLERYEQRACRRIAEQFDRPLPVGQALAELLAEFTAEASADAGRRGCFIGNCAAELAARDGRSRARLGQSFARIEAAFRAGLDRAQAAGELPADHDTRALARFLTSALQGLRLIAKTNPEPAVLADVVATTLRCLEQPTRGGAAFQGEPNP